MSRSHKAEQIVRYRLSQRKSREWKIYEPQQIEVRPKAGLANPIPGKKQLVIAFDYGNSVGSRTHRVSDLEFQIAITVNRED